jgi:hypothetical protein
LSTVNALINPARLDSARVEMEPFSGFASIVNTQVFHEFMHRPEKTIAFFTGNQWGKNVNIVRHYIMRLMGWHPIESKNMRPSTKIRKLRFCSEKLPYDPDGGDSNTVYPIFKRMWPRHLIRKDVTQRRPRLTLIDPQGGPDIEIEFSSYGQDVQAQAGIQLWSCYIDEFCSREFYSEQIPRLLVADGDIVIGMTPALGDVSWQFDELYEKASVFYRTPRVCKRLKYRYNEDHEEFETTANNSDIAVFMAATDDNPYYDQLVKEKNERELKLISIDRHPLYKKAEDFEPITKSSYIAEKLGFYDEESEDVRRYGIFRQKSGRIFKDFDTRIHVIDPNKLFPDGVPHQWVHGRAIDYHQSTPWHTTFIALSPQDEAFIYEESVLSPERYVTLQICREIAEKSKDYKYALNKIDPLAAQTQTNTGMSTLMDVNRIFPELKRDGLGTGGYWTTWDTKSTRGREEVRKRINNSRKCGSPFNNRQIVNGREIYLPTIWIFSNCRETIDSLKNWRLEAWSDRSKLETKDPKETPMQRYSHICTAIECLFKEAGFRPRADNIHAEPQRRTAAQYGRRIA